MSKKHSKEQVLKDNLSKIHSPIDVEELSDIIYLRDRWYHESKKHQSSFGATYKTEHG